MKHRNTVITDQTHSSYSFFSFELTAYFPLYRLFTPQTLKQLGKHPPYSHSLEKRVLGVDGTYFVGLGLAPLSVGQIAAHGKGLWTVAVLKSCCLVSE